MSRINFEAVFDGDNSIDLFDAFLSHLLLEEASYGTAKDDMPFACFAPQVLPVEVRVVVDCVLDAIFQTDDCIVTHWFSAKCDF